MSYLNVFALIAIRGRRGGTEPAYVQHVRIYVTVTELEGESTFTEKSLDEKVLHIPERGGTRGSCGKREGRKK